MSYDIRKPMITAPTPEGQLSQIKSYLLQLADQLGFALNDIAKGTPATASAETAKSTERAADDPGLESRFVAFQSQIIGGSVADTMTLGKRLEGTEAEKYDLNALKTPGCYYSPDGAFIENSPTDGGFRLEVKLIDGDDRILQSAYYGARHGARYFDGSEWSEWSEWAERTQNTQGG